MTRDYAAIPALKQILAARTGDEGWLNIRPPLLRVAPEAAARLLDEWNKLPA